MFICEEKGTVQYYCFRQLGNYLGNSAAVFNASWCIKYIINNTQGSIVKIAEPKKLFEFQADYETYTKGLQKLKDLNLI